MSPTQEQSSTRRIRHPIGAGASPQENQLTDANRDALSQCLHQYYHGDLLPGGTARYEPGRGSGPRNTGSGVELSDRVTSHLEIANALRELEFQRRDLHRVVERYFRHDESKESIDHDNHWRHGEAAKRIEAAINWMIPLVFFDPQIRGD